MMTRRAPVAVLLVPFLAAGLAGSARATTQDEVRSLIAAGDYAAAEGRARALLKATQAAEDAESIAVADALDLLVESLWRGNKAGDPEARRLAERAVAIREKASGPNGLDVAASLAILAGVLRDAGDLAAARPVYERVLEIRERVLGPEHPEVARALNGLSNVLGDAGDLGAAEALCERALRIRETALGPHHPDVGASLNNLAILKMLTGDYAAASPLFERALAVRETALGPDHPDVGAALQNLASVARLLGDYPRARSLYERSLEIAEKTAGPESFEAAAAVSNLGILLGQMGDAAAAEAAHRRALRIWEKVLPPAHSQVAYGLDNVGTVLLENGDPAGAQPFFERALHVLEGAFGPDHPDVALCLSSQALARAWSGDRPGAKRLFERAVAIQERTLGPRHPDLAATLSNLGVLLKNMGEYPAARASYERALEIREAVLGPGHPDTAGTLDNLARLLWLQGRNREALQKGLLAEQGARGQFARAGRELSEREALRYEAVRVSGLDTVLTALLSLPDREERRTASAAAWDEEVRARAVVLDEMAARNRTLAGQEAPAVRPHVEALASARGGLARLLVRGPDPREPESFVRDVQEAQAAQDRAERALAQASAEFRIELERRQTGLAEVLAALPPGSALLAYVRYGRLVEVDGRAAVPSYLAFVSKSGGPGPEVVPLGPAQEIDTLIRLWREELAADPRRAAANRSPEEGASSPGLETGTRLREEIWDPVAEYLQGATTVFVVPDGAISLVNLATLPDGAGTYLLESGPTLHHVSAERDLARATGRRLAAAAVLVVGGPDFDFQGKAPSPVARIASPFRSAPATCSSFRSLEFEPLPGALAEADEVGSIWKERTADVVVLTGSRADEATFKQAAGGSRILHLATHGYFVQGDCVPGVESPLLLAGLALAGANRRGTARDREEAEDGMLTAEEIATLDLSGAEWVVLSACETGVGRVQDGEGVLGLRRAFEIAGARTLIMSLWRVEDEAARLFMRELYRARLAGLSTAESVRKASLGIVAVQRRQGLPDHPYFWGAFVAAGDWR